MGIPLRKGRFLKDTDRTQPVGVISETTARWFWSNQNPIGKHLRTLSLREPAFEVIGVVGDVLAGGPETRPPLTIYQPYWTVAMVFPTFVLRTETTPKSVLAPLQSVLQEIDRGVALSQTKTMNEVIEETVQARKFQMHLAVAFALAAVALASFGIYGVIAFTVTRRTREFGIRVALGARAQQIVGMVVRQGMRPVLVGLGVGVGLALFIGSLLASELYGITPRDPLTFGSVVLLLLLVAFVACYLPAYRATSINPNISLRCE